FSCDGVWLRFSVVGHSVSCRYWLGQDAYTGDFYALSLHDALPIWPLHLAAVQPQPDPEPHAHGRTGRAADRLHPHHAGGAAAAADRKSTRLNSSHVKISYAVFCLKKKRCGHQRVITTPTDCEAHDD